MTYSDEDDDSIAKDGEVVRVPFHLMDSVQRAVARPRSFITDAFGRPAGSAPGYVFGPRTAQTTVRDAAFESEGRLLADAWRHPERNEGRAPAFLSREEAFEAQGEFLRNAWRNAR